MIGREEENCIFSLHHHFLRFLTALATNYDAGDNELLSLFTRNDNAPDCRNLEQKNNSRNPKLNDLSLAFAEICNAVGFDRKNLVSLSEFARVPVSRSGGRGETRRDETRKRLKCLAEKCHLMLRHWLKQWSFSYSRVSVCLAGRPALKTRTASSLPFVGSAAAAAAAAVCAAPGSAPSCSLATLFRRSGPSP